MLRFDTPIPYAARRWAQSIVRTLDSPFDPKTVEAWGRCIGVSPASLCQWCRAARVRPKPSLDLARLLRAIYLAGHGAWALYDLLDIVDERTMRQIFRRGGLSAPADGDSAPDLRTFMAQQRFVPRGAALDAVAALIDRLPPRGLGTRPA